VLNLQPNVVDALVRPGRIASDFLRPSLVMAVADVAVGASREEMPTNGYAFQTEDYEEIVKFRDAVLSGTHPRVRLPPHMILQKPATSPSDGMYGRASESAALDSDKYSTRIALQRGENSHTSGQNGRQLPVSPSSGLPGLGIFSPKLTAVLPISYKEADARSSGMQAEHDRVFSERSNDPLRAEMRTQRKRLEIALQDQVDQQRMSQRTILKPSDPLPDFDVNIVFAKATAMSDALSGRVRSADNSPPVRSMRSDSFDDETFYTSEIGEPIAGNELDDESRKVAEAVDIEEGELEEGSPYEPPLYIESPSARPSILPDAPLSRLPDPAAGFRPPVDYALQLHGDQAINHSFETLIFDSDAVLQESLEQIDHGPNAGRRLGKADLLQLQATGMERISSQDSGEASESADSIYGQQDGPGSSNAAQAKDFIGSSTNLSHLHRLSQLATPQPAFRSSPETNNIHNAGIPQIASVATPAQVAALRKEASGTSSQESSPQSNDVAERRTRVAKRNKRKADRAVEDLPYIKPEPKSPSPLAVQQLPRPSKRQKRRNGRNRTHDDPRLRQAIPLDDDFDDYTQLAYRPTSRQISSLRPNRSYRPHLPVNAPTARQERIVEYVREDRPGSFIQLSETHVMPPYSSYEGERPEATIPQHASYHQPYGEVSADLYGPQDKQWTPQPHGYQGPSQFVRPSRVIIDDYGREYIEPTQQLNDSRHSVAPFQAAPSGLYDERSMTATGPPRASEFDGDGSAYRGIPPNSNIRQRDLTAAEGPGAHYRPHGEQREFPPPRVSNTFAGPPSFERPQYAPPRLSGEYRSRAELNQAQVDVSAYDDSGAYGARRAAATPALMPGRAASVRPIEVDRYGAFQRPDSVLLEGPIRAFTRAATARPMQALSGSFIDGPHDGYNAVPQDPTGAPYAGMPAPPPLPVRAASVRPDAAVHYGPPRPFPASAQPFYDGQFSANQAPTYGRPAGGYYQ
jgi:hypothetical protein